MGGYAIVEDVLKKDLIHNVNELLKEGFTLAGGIQVYVESTSMFGKEVHYMQALVKI